MNLLKIKDWVESKNNIQFKVLKRYDGKQIKTVERIEDGVEFNLFNFFDYRDEKSSFAIVKFNEDLVHVDYEIHEFYKNIIVGSCEIGDILLSGDGGIVKYLLDKGNEHVKN